MRSCGTVVRTCLFTSAIAISRFAISSSSDIWVASFGKAPCKDWNCQRAENRPQRMKTVVTDLPSPKITNNNPGLTSFVCLFVNPVQLYWIADSRGEYVADNLTGFGGFFDRSLKKLLKLLATKLIHRNLAHFARYSWSKRSQKINPIRPYTPPA